MTSADRFGLAQKHLAEAMQATSHAMGEVAAAMRSSVDAAGKVTEARSPEERRIACQDLDAAPCEEIEAIRKQGKAIEAQASAMRDATVIVRERTQTRLKHAHSCATVRPIAMIKA
jgi:hypothetical protein